MYLPKVIAFNAKDETAKTIRQIADFMGLGGNTQMRRLKILSLSAQDE